MSSQIWCYLFSSKGDVMSAISIKLCSDIAHQKQYLQLLQEKQLLPENSCRSSVEPIYFSCVVTMIGSIMFQHSCTIMFTLQVTVVFIVELHFVLHASNDSIVTKTMGVSSIKKMSATNAVIKATGMFSISLQNCVCLSLRTQFKNATKCQDSCKVL